MDWTHNSIEMVILDWITIIPGRDYVVLKIWHVTLTLFKYELLNWWIIVFVFVVAINISGVVAPGLLAFSSWRRIVKHLNKTEWNLVGGLFTNFRNNYDDEKFRIVNPVSQIQKERNRYGKIRITYPTSTFQKAKKIFFKFQLADPNTANSLQLTNEKNTRFYSTMNTQFVVQSRMEYGQNASLY